MKPIEVKGNTYNDNIKEVNDKDPKFKVDDHLRMSKYKNVFAKGYTSKLMIILECQSTKMFLLKDILQIGLKNVL